MICNNESPAIQNVYNCPVKQVKLARRQKRIVHTAVYKQKLNQYNNAFIHYEQYIKADFEQNKNIKNVDDSVNCLKPPQN